MSQAETSDVLLEARGIVKGFPGVRALEGVDLRARSGRLMALVGENGAGKSTLMNILAGVFPADAGEILIDGRAVAFADTRQAQTLGIAIVFQELNFFAYLSVAENIFLGREFLTRAGLVDFRRMHRAAGELLGRLELSIDPGSLMVDLRVGQRQLVEIAKALSREPRVLILDEPTSALSDHEIQILFRLIGDLKRRGIAIIYISHKLDELYQIGDDVSVLRDGRLTGAGPLANFSRDDLVRLMVGREIAAFRRESQATRGAEVLRVEGMSLAHPERPNEDLVRNISLTVHRGEILGLFGLMGAGRTELVETIFGIHAGRARGRVLMEGQPVSIRSPRDAITAGIGLVPEDRREEGLVLAMSVVANASLAGLEQVERLGWLSRRAEKALVRPWFERFGVKTPSLDQPVQFLSGGNQQKVILSKWLATEPKLLILDEPTRGIDVHAKREIYGLIDTLTRMGLGVILVSSELPEILALADRIMVLCEGRQAGEFSRHEASEEIIMQVALPRRALQPARIG